jgi:hypothetical protein
MNMTIMATATRSFRRIGSGARFYGAVALLTLPGAATAQAVAVSPHVGTLGVGADVSVALSDLVSLRGGLNFQPYAPKADFEDIDYELNLPSPTLSGMVDLHVGGSGFRVSGGVVYFSDDPELEATPSEPTEIGDQIYSPSEIGTLTGTVRTNNWAPYLGIGWGNASHGSVGFFMDLGVAFHGEPDVDLTADGLLGSDPDFLDQLDREIADVQDDVESVTVYPILSVGVRFGVR